MIAMTTTFPLDSDANLRIRLSSMPRGEAVALACDELTKQGIKPSVSKVQLMGVKGSPADVQRDVNLWFLALFTEYHAKQAMGSVPASAVELFDALWKRILALAEERYDEARKAAEERINTLCDDVGAEQERSRSLLEEKIALEGSLRVANENIGECEARLCQVQDALLSSSERASQLERELGNIKVVLDELRLDHQQRVDSLVADHSARLGEVTGRYEAMQKEINAQHTERINEMAVQHTERIEEMRGQMNLAEERYTALERRSLMEIDRARQDAVVWKQDAETCRQRLDQKVRSYQGEIETLTRKLSQKEGQSAAAELLVVELQEKLRKREFDKDDEGGHRP